MDAERYIEIMSEIVGCAILVLSRVRRIAWARFMVEYMLLRDGYGTEAAGRMVGKSHAAAVWARKQVDHMLRNPKMYPEEMALWNEYVKRLNQIK